MNRPRVQVRLPGAAARLYGVLENLMSRPGPRLVTTRRVPASVWAAALGCLAMIVGGLSEWATAWGFLSLSASRFHGANEVGAALVGLAMLAAHLWRGARFPLLVAWLTGALGALQAMLTLLKIHSEGSLTFFGVRYRYVSPSWGLYLVLAGALVLMVCSAVAWKQMRA